MKLISVAAMKALEQAANDKGLSYEQMMLNAGNGLARLVFAEYSTSGQPLNILGLVGSGNNGGDTLIALISLQKRGWQTYAIIHKKSELISQLQKEFEEIGGIVTTGEQIMNIPQIDLVLDGFLGTGGKPPLKNDLILLLREIKNSLAQYPIQPKIIAVDCPSGVDCDSGDIPEETLRADLTVCMGAVKQGLVKFPALGVCGEFGIVDFGLDQVIPEWSDGLIDVIDNEVVKSMMPVRPIYGHKGSFGKVLVIGGSANFMGAPILAAHSAGRVGTGLVTAATIERVQQNMASIVPEITWDLLAEYDGMIDPTAAEHIGDKISDYAVILVGPGMGHDARMSKLLTSLLAPQASRANPAMGFSTTVTKPGEKNKTIQIPLVIDADGLRILADISNWTSLITPGNVLTPHPGEMAALTDLPVEEIQKDRVAVCQKYAQKWQQIVVLKGAGTVVASPTGEIAILPIATTALAHAGSGDVLAGMIAGLIAQKLDGYKAACAAVYLHARAGLLAAALVGSPASVLPVDISNQIGRAINSVIKYQ